MWQLLSTLALLQAETTEDLPFDPETFAMISIVMTVVLLIVGIAVGYWVYKDASKRGNNELLWAAGVGGLLFLFFPIGIVVLIAYFVLRGDVVEPEAPGVEAKAEW